MFFIGDNSEFSSPQVKKQDVFCMGGFFANISTLKEIESVLNNVKRKYGIPEELPLKWNMKDEMINKIYNACGASEKLSLLILKSEEWREYLFQSISALDLRLIVSGMRALGATTKEDVCEMLFINLLERVRKEWENYSDNSINLIVLDWEEELRNKYSKIYCDFYYIGKTKGSFPSKPLINHENAFPALSFSVCLFNPLLQVADLIIGCYRMFFEFCFKNKNKEAVQKLLPYIMKKTIVNKNGNPFGRGIIFRPKDDQDKVYIKLLELKLL